MPPARPVVSRHNHSPPPTMNKALFLLSLLLLALGATVGLFVIVPAGIAYWITYQQVFPSLAQAGLGEQIGGITGWLIALGLVPVVYKALFKRNARWWAILAIGLGVGGVQFACRWLTSDHLLHKPLYATFNVQGDISLSRDPVSPVTGRTNILLGPENAAYIHQSIHRAMEAVDPLTTPWFDAAGTPVVFLSRMVQSDTGLALWEAFNRFGYHPATGALLSPASPTLRETFEQDTAAANRAAKRKQEELLDEEISAERERHAQIEQELRNNEADLRAKLDQAFEQSRQLKEANDLLELEQVKRQAIELAIQQSSEFEEIKKRQKLEDGAKRQQEIAPITISRDDSRFIRQPLPRIGSGLAELGRIVVLLRVNDRGRVTKAEVEHSSGSRDHDRYVCDFIMREWLAKLGEPAIFRIALAFDPS